MPLDVINELSTLNVPGSSQTSSDSRNVHYHQEVNFSAVENYQSRGAVETSHNSEGLKSTETKIPSFMRAFALEQIFEYEDRSESFLEKNDVDKAYTMMKRKIDMGRHLIYARHLVSFYNLAMLSKRSEMGAHVRDELLPIVRACANATPDDAEAYAAKLERRERWMPAILFYQIAALLHVSERPTGAREAAAGVTVCCEGVRNTCKSLLKRRPDLKPLVQHHVISVMHEMRTALRRAEVSDAELTCNCEAKCLHCVEYIEGRVGDYESRELTLREAIAMVEGRLGADCKKLGVYSLLLNNLACTFEVRQHYEEACVFYAKAVAAHRAAEDYQSEEQRRADIESSERGMRRATNKLNKSMLQHDNSCNVMGDC